MELIYFHTIKHINTNVKEIYLKTPFKKQYTNFNKFAYKTTKNKILTK